MERYRSHLVWEAWTDFGSVGAGRKCDPEKKRQLFSGIGPAPRGPHRPQKVSTLIFPVARRVRAVAELVREPQSGPKCIECGWNPCQCAPPPSDEEVQYSYDDY